MNNKERKKILKISEIKKKQLRNGEEESKREKKH